MNCNDRRIRNIEVELEEVKQYVDQLLKHTGVKGFTKEGEIIPTDEKIVLDELAKKLIDKEFRYKVGDIVKIEYNEYNLKATVEKKYKSGGEKFYTVKILDESRTDFEIGEYFLKKVVID